MGLMLEYPEELPLFKVTEAPKHRKLSRNCFRELMSKPSDHRGFDLHVFLLG